MNWLASHLAQVGTLLVTHTVLAALPLVIGLLLAVPLGWLARRFPVLRTPIIAGTGLLYTIPSLGLFALLWSVFGIPYLSETNLIVALTILAIAWWRAAVLYRGGDEYGALVVTGAAMVAASRGLGAW